MQQITSVKNNFPIERLRIEYMLGNLCNHKCSYCFPGSNEGDYPWPKKELVMENLGHLIETYKNYGKTKPILYLIGGEPTLWKDLPEVCRYFQDYHNCDIRISTNGSKSRNWWSKNCNFFNTIELSVHHEFARIDHLKKVADIIYENDRFIVANVLMDHRNFDRCKEIIEQLKDSIYDWPILAKVVHFGGETFYSSDQKEYLKDRIKRYPNMDWYNRVGSDEITQLQVTFSNGEIKNLEGDQWLSMNNLNKFKGFHCNIGLEQLKIFQNGEISANCRQKIFHRNEPFNLYDKNFTKEFNPSLDPIICNKEICSCKSEIAVTKWKS